jgi:glycosyltransferase involved in cell wall biosynthesis
MTTKMTKRMKISAIVIAKDEEGMIGNCLKTLNWVDEIIVIDDESKDRTVEIAKKFTNKVFTYKMQDFASQRNFGLKKAEEEWILYIDADERITPELAREIQTVINYQSRRQHRRAPPKRGFATASSLWRRTASIINDCAAYAIPRRNFLLGKEMHWGGWWPDYQIRFFKKSCLKKWEGELHERPVFKGKLGYLKSSMVHITHRDLSSMVEKTREWSKIEARLLYNSNHPPVTWWRILKAMAIEFWQRFIRGKAWRDGTVGWIEGLFQVLNRFLIYASLWELQKQKKNEIDFTPF